MTTAFDDKPLEPIGRRRGGSFDAPPRRNPANWLRDTWEGITPIYRNGIKIAAIALPIVIGSALLGSFGNAPVEVVLSDVGDDAIAQPESDDEHAQINTALWALVTS